MTASNIVSVSLVRKNDESNLLQEAVLWQTYPIHASPNEIEKSSKKNKENHNKLRFSFGFLLPHRGMTPVRYS
jgi:hypothetical protein